ncbi:MAG: Rrf2 family transcriptional regulator [Geminicoccaceae bacterium]|jgi:Rrf2 family protein|nr:Rrf2 family transcriptional regulator [Geminicoccaceae bacterium]HRY24451.1 Rrf2 family transcriptional regulator [Geminicoccaceae bacterium]
MIKPSKKVALAVEAVVDIAYHGTSEPVQSQDIGRRLNLPRRYLEQVMQQLVKAGILRGVRGPRGGYRLARERRRITVADIVNVVESGEAEPDTLSASDLGQRVMAPFWLEHEQAMLARLDAITIEDLCHAAEQSAVRREIKDGIDFAI